MRSARGTARRIIVVCVVCVLLGVVGTFVVLVLANRHVMSVVPADAMRGFLATGAGEACRTARKPWVFTTPGGAAAGFYDRHALPADAGPDPAVVARLTPERPEVVEFFFTGHGGGAFAAFVADSGPCSLYYTRWPSMPGARPMTLIALVGVLVVATAVGAAVAVRLITRRAVRGLEAVAEVARHVGDRAPDLADQDELIIVGEALAWAHTRIETDRQVLLERARALEAHLADLAHDLRTPLTSLFMRLELLASDPDASETIKEQAAEALGDAVYLSSLAENRRLESEFAHAGRGPAGEAIDWSEVAIRVARRYRLVARGRGTQIDVEGDAGTVGDAVLAEQVLANLVQNAVVHGGGAVQIVLRTIGLGFAVEVRDDGPGVTPEELARLGTRHYRGDLARQRAPYGSGLGLAIACTIADRHGWRLTFHHGSPSGLVARIESTGPRG